MADTIRMHELPFQEPYDTYRWAETLFELRDYISAADVLTMLLEQLPDDSGRTAAEELLVRSYFYSARLDRAIDTARDVLQRDPADAYMALLLMRSLERAGRSEEAAAARRMAEALGAQA